MSSAYHREGPAPNRPERALEWDDLPALFPFAAGPDRWLPLLRRHAELIEAAAPRTRVSSVPPDEVIRRQYAESLELLRLAGGSGVAGPLVDVGSGGGFPGLVVAIVVPGLEVYLVEPMKRRAALLEELSRELGLAQVTVHAVRAEEAGRSPLRGLAATVMARAVAPLRELLEYTAPLCRPDGLLALAKGSGAAAEVESAAKALAELGCEVEGITAMRGEVSRAISVVLLRKRGATAERYPRRPGVPGKRPL